MPEKCMSDHRLGVLISRLGSHWLAMRREGKGSQI